MKKLAVAVAVSTCLVFLIIAGFPRLCDAATIYGCYGKFIGMVRVVSGPGKCDLKLETPISWNSEGPAGPQGLQGPPGLKGDKGDKGDPGPAGEATLPECPPDNVLLSTTTGWICRPVCSGLVTDIQSNASHCSACGNACLSGESCSLGVCIRPYRVLVNEIYVSESQGGLQAKVEVFNASSVPTFPFMIFYYDEIANTNQFLVMEDEPIQPLEFRTYGPFPIASVLDGGVAYGYGFIGLSHMSFPINDKVTFGYCGGCYYWQFNLNQGDIGYCYPEQCNSGEGMPLPFLQSGDDAARSPNGKDTNVNRADFQITRSQTLGIPNP